MRIPKLCCFIALVYLLCVDVSAQNRVIISKRNFELIVLNSESDTLAIYRCGIGLNPGDKKCVGDKRTPEGKFLIASIENSKHWTHDFLDGAGPRTYAYGPYFIRLETPGWSGIGIHGTIFPESIGTRCSDGCVRLKNEDLSDLIRYIDIGTEVIIKKDEIFYDPNDNH